MNHKDKAVDLFYQGYNCSQATLMAFSDLIDHSEADMAKIASSFGGGMGHMGEVCGALTGVFMAAGAIFGYNNPNNKQEKDEHYALIQEIARRFKVQKGAILCRDLLVKNKKSPHPTSRIPGKSCEHLVVCASEILDDIIKEKSMKGLNNEK